MHGRGQARINDDPVTIWTVLFRSVGGVKRTGQATLVRTLGELRQEEVGEDDDKRYTYVP